MEDENEANESFELGKMHRRRAHIVRHWMRHAAMVPKGFLRYQLLKKLNQKPMSGSEIMSDLENETKGYWRPSPGSIYPLLAWLQDQNLIKEAEQTEPGIRRYTLTDSGRASLETERQSREEINKHMQNLGNMWYGLHREPSVTGKVARDFFRASRDLHHELRKEHPKDEIEQAKKALEEVTKQIQEITNKLQNRRDS
jgi:DNA-binding PadR family transcriptional regulator